MTDKPDELVEVRLMMPTKLRDSLVSFCGRFNLKFDDIVCGQVEKWLLGQKIAILEASAEDKEGQPSDPRR